MLLSRACEYGIRAVLYLARHNEMPYISVREIAENTNISFHFLGKILQTLTRKGLLISYKGPKGGISLARPPEDITVFQIVEAIDGAEFLTKCIVGMPSCDKKNPCALHENWIKIRGHIIDMLGKNNLAQLAVEDRSL